MKIDFVSDVACPWCAIGLNALEQALARPDGTVQADIRFQPFELNPQMPPAGEEIVEHLTRKYGTTPADVERKHALLHTYFTEGEDPGDHEVLIRVAGEVGLDPSTAKAILGSDRHAAEVRDCERFYQDQGIHSVPSIMIDDRHLIEGEHPVDEFERALRQLA